LTKATIPVPEYYGRSRSVRWVDNFVPSLGLGYLAAVLREDGFEVRIHDPVVPEGVHEIERMVREWRPELAGISVFTPHVRSLRDLLPKLGELRCRPRVVLGGSHVTALPLGTLEKHAADAGVVGEGEETLLEVARAVRRGDKSLSKIDGLVLRENGTVCRTGPRALIRSLDRIPFPARDLMPAIWKTRPTPASLRRVPLGVMITSRGCPFGCRFCDRSVFGRTYRKRSIENCAGEIDELINRYGAREIKFFDDDIAIDREHLVGVAGIMRSLPRKTPWTCQMNAVHGDTPVFRDIRRSGCWQVLFGLESGDQRGLERLGKPASLEQSVRAVRAALAAGLRVRADFIVGTPGESLEDMDRTVRFAKDLNVDFAHFNKFMPFPGTDFHKELVRRGAVFDYDENWSDSDNSVVRFVPDGVDPVQYRRFLDRATRNFYLRPRYLVRRLLRIRTLTELKAHVRGLAAVLFL
jgi:radical SAM superfamily enzyme YgiQ (UPF0313 family)